MATDHPEPAAPPVGPFIFRILDTKSQEPQAAHAQSTFYRNLDEALDLRRSSSNFYSVVENTWDADGITDFYSGDMLGLGKSDVRRAEFLAELGRFPDFTVGPTGARVIDGTYSYLKKSELEIASFHGAEHGMLMSSAFEANVAVWTAVPRPGDVILYDALVHASTREGIKQSLAIDKVEFPHNSVDGFRRVLGDIFASNRLVREAKRTVLVAVESIYSMDGDVCPLQELLEVADEFSRGQGNVQFVVDEAHSLGVIGPKGAGLVCELGLQKEIAIVVHSYGKALGAVGGFVLASTSIRDMMANFARSIIYSTSPSFPFVAAIKSGYKLLRDGHTEEAQERIQHLVRFFFETLTSHSVWPAAQQMGLLLVPLAKDWEERPFLTHIIPIFTRQKYNWWLFFHILDSNFCTFPMEHPIVPLGQRRIRAVLHAYNTEDEVRKFVNAIFTWVEEMVSIENGSSEYAVPHAARRVYAWMAQEKLTGFGKP
ncbi:Aminotransferase [Apiospora phragmitis]|uniref:Aminotransferase n=1 Tax=Apiospora phragmitis TaxID=2905665 RepID=A0ABR1T4D2_9PEZI